MYSLKVQFKVIPEGSGKGPRPEHTEQVQKAISILQAQIPNVLYEHGLVPKTQPNIRPLSFQCEFRDKLDTDDEELALDSRGGVVNPVQDTPKVEVLYVEKDGRPEYRMYPYRSRAVIRDTEGEPIAEAAAHGSTIKLAVDKSVQRCILKYNTGIVPDRAHNRRHGKPIWEAKGKREVRINGELLWAT